MPRIRTIKPEAFQHRKVGRLTDRQFRVWVAMLTQADDEGRLVADASQLRALIYGYQPRVRTEEIEAAIQHLAGVGLITLYSTNDRRAFDEGGQRDRNETPRFAFFPSWRDHQRIDRPRKSQLPGPPTAQNAAGSPSSTTPFDEPSTNDRESSRGVARPRRGSDRKGSSPLPPSGDSDRTGTLPPEAFNTDCPDRYRWADPPRCLNRAWLASHPEVTRYPALDSKGTPRQCPHHRSLQPATQDDQVKPAW
jgi:hypothetical protein